MDAKEVTAALDAVAEEEVTPESSDGAEKVEVEAKPEASVETPETKEVPEGKKGKGAQDRIKELVGARDTLSSQVEDLNSKLSSRDDELSKLVDLLQSRESDAKTIAKINDLYNSDPKWKNTIEALDQAVQNKDVEVPELEPSEGEKEGKEDDPKVIKKAIESTRENLEEKLAEHEAKVLLHQANTVLEKYFDKLPEDKYNERDLKELGKDVVEKINWEAIEEDPSPTNLRKIVHDGFQETVKEYGTPRGELEAKAKSQSENPDDPTASAPKKTAEDLQGKNWGKLADTGQKDRHGRVIRQPVISEDDFAAVLAEGMKRDNEAG